MSNMARTFSENLSGLTAPVTVPRVSQPETGHTRHPWPCDVHYPNCAIPWFDLMDQPCKSKNAETCCYCGGELKVR